MSGTKEFEKCIEQTCVGQDQVYNFINAFTDTDFCNAPILDKLFGQRNVRCD